jgi:hypothetical protein
VKIIFNIIIIRLLHKYHQPQVNIVTVGIVVDSVSEAVNIGVVCRPGVKKLSVVKEKAVSRKIGRFFCLSSLNIGRLVRGCKEIG